MPHCSCGKCTCDFPNNFIEIREKEQLYECLIRLDETFGNVKSQILGTNPTPTIGTAFYFAIEDEKHKQIAVTQRIPLEVAIFQTERQHVDKDNNKKISIFQSQHKRDGEREGGRRDCSYCLNCR